jgi:hypothetical protein
LGLTKKPREKIYAQLAGLYIFHNCLVISKEKFICS